MNRAAIPVFRPPIPSGWKRDLEHAISSRWFGYGPACRRLEQEFLHKRGGWALATSSCTSAMYVAARRIKQLTAGGEVIVPAITFISTAMAFYEAGLNVRIADVDANTLLMDPASAQSLITSKTRAIVVVHTYGQKLALKPFRQLCNQNGLILVEDCAHRLAARSEASEADFACFSFNAVKEAAAGEGGMLWGRNLNDETSSRAISYLGMHVDTLQRTSSTVHRSYDFGEDSGLKLRAFDLSAAFVLSCFRQLDEWRYARKAIAEAYDRAFRKLGGAITLLPRDIATDSCLMYVLRVRASDRARIQRVMATNSIATSVHYPSLAQHPLFIGQACASAEKSATEVLTLPCFPDLSKAAQHRVIAAFSKAVGATST